jgi:hypothetical protein
MKINRLLGVLIVAAWLSGTAVHGQTSPLGPLYPPPSPTTPDGAPNRPEASPLPASGVLSDWILNKRDCCEGRHGIYTPLYTEVYLNAGPSVPIGGMTLSRELKTGWSITGGARALFFNEPLTQAWTVDLHIINTDESGGRRNTQFPVTIFQNGTKFVFGPGGIPGAGIQNSNRTLAGAGVGREWYLWRPATTDGCMWRVGVDGGGRYGSSRINLNEFGHLIDVVGCLYAAAHTDLEFPCGALLFHAGLRCEWAYTWGDILQRTSDVQELNFLLTVGVRF